MALVNYHHSPFVIANQMTNSHHHDSSPKAGFLLSGENRCTGNALTGILNSDRVQPSSSFPVLQNQWAQHAVKNTSHDSSLTHQ